MEHAEIQEKVLLLRDGELSDSERLSVEEHLKECPSCRELHAAVGRIGPMLFNDPEPPASKQFVLGVMAHVGEAEDTDAAEDEVKLPMHWWVPVFSFGLAAAVLLGAFPRHRQSLTLELLFAARTGVPVADTQNAQVKYLSDLLVVPLEGR
jgi:anti-sigma factor RsiW